MASTKTRKNKLKSQKTIHKIDKSVLYLVFCFLGILVVLISQFYLALKEYRYSFFKSLPTNQVEYVKGRNYPTRIEIPTLNLNLEVEPGFIYKGRWSVSDKSATHLRQSAALGENNNIVIYGHNTRKIFGRLVNLKKNDQIFLSSEKDKQIEFRVISKFTVNPTEISYVSPKDKEMLTIYTCTGLLDSLRVIVQALPVRTLNN